MLLWLCQMPALILDLECFKVLLQLQQLQMPTVEPCMKLKYFSNIVDLLRIPVFFIPVLPNLLYRYIYVHVIITVIMFLLRHVVLRQKRGANADLVQTQQLSLPEESDVATALSQFPSCYSQAGHRFIGQALTSRRHNDLLQRWPMAGQAAYVSRQMEGSPAHS